MSSRTRHFLPYIPIILAVLAAAGCQSSSKTSTNASPTPSASPADAGAIRNVDFSQQPAVKSLIAQFGGELDPKSIIYADLTGDSRDEAVVPIFSGGTLGNLAYLVYTIKSGAPAVILTRTIDRSSRSGLHMDVEDGKLVESVGQYGPEDPLCCPTMLRKTYFRWDGNSLQVDREEQVPSSNTPKKQ